MSHVITEGKRVYLIYEREDGYKQWVVRFGRTMFDIEEWKGTFTVDNWFTDNEYNSLAAAVSAIKEYERVK